MVKVTQLHTHEPPYFLDEMYVCSFAHLLFSLSLHVSDQVWRGWDAARVWDEGIKFLGEGGDCVCVFE